MGWTNSDWINLATAGGTFFAAGVALWIAGATTRKQAKEEVEKARLVAASMTVRLAHVRDVVNGCAATAVFNDLTVPKESSDFKALQSIMEVIRKDFFTPSNADLQALIPLGNNCAHRIARAYDYIGRVRESAKGVGNERFKDTLTAQSRERMLEVWAGTLLSAVDLLTVAIRECEAAADIGAPFPSGQELHGERDWLD